MMQPVIATVVSCLVVVFGSTAIAQAKLEYNRDIRPILADHCFACHGPDSAARKGDLRLDQQAAALESGAIVPGQPDNSELVRRILSADAEEIMPPPELKHPLTEEHRNVLIRWIREGADYQPHWSLIPPVRSSVPEVPDSLKSFFSSWPVNPIDHFILDRLAAENLTPAAEADRRTLARRVSLDLTGLPPTPEDVDAFVVDSSPNAYERLVDRLLALPQWGEHRGRYWLDYARYADTHGFHFDNYREMWTYRDWVIDAFNHNMPFDEFTVENLAGDMLPNATLSQKIASGFNRCNMTTNEGGIIDEEYAVLYARDRTETVAQVWMALTVGCAVCHSHKFDPISQREFYEMSAFFNNTTQRVRDGNVKDTPPIIVVPLPHDRDRWDALPGLLVAADNSVNQRKLAARPEFDQWLTTATPTSLGEPVSNDMLHLQAALNEGEGRTTKLVVEGESLELPLPESASWQDGPFGKAIAVQGSAAELPAVGDFESDQAFTCTAWVRVPPNDSYGAICARMDRSNAYRGWDFWLQQRRIGTHMAHSWPEKGLKVVSKQQLPANEWVHVAFSYDGSRKASGIKIYINGVVQEVNVENDKLDQSTIRTEVPWQIGQRSNGDGLTGAIQDLRIYRRILSASEANSLAKLSRYEATLAKALDQRTSEEINQLYDYWLSRFDESFRTMSTAVAGLRKEQADIQARGTIAHVMNEREEAPIAYVLNRGEYDQRLEQVSPNTPAALPAFAESLSRNRIGFAQWLLSPEHPLTARVTVNRCWQEVFGTGLVRSTGDFGVSGELPSHPELLDWLAVDFRESGWDVKRLYKTMVMSAAYRQSAEVTPQKLEIDPANRLLSRGSRFRMDAEMVRDYALKVSGLLIPKIGGPSVKPYQPEGVWEAIAMTVSNTRSYQPDSGEGLYRRSLYTFVKRMAPPASMDLFNAPNRETCTVRRERTNTPLQALTTLNDVQFVEAARHLAQQVLKSSADTNSRLQSLAGRVLSRPFRETELPILQTSLNQLTGFYSQHPEDAEKLIHVGESKPEASNAAELAAWTMLVNQVLNLDEVLNK